MRVRVSDAECEKWENRAAKIEPHGKKAVRHAFRASKGNTHVSYMNYVAYSGVAVVFRLICLMRHHHLETP